MVSVESIIAVVAEMWGVDAAQIKGNSRAHSVSRVRHVCMYLARELTDLSAEEIGRHFASLDHSGPLYGARVIRGLIAEDAELAAQIQIAMRRLRDGLSDAKIAKLIKACEGAWHALGSIIAVREGIPDEQLDRASANVHSKRHR